jgi:8-oxo-dGTP pyrophosphatase MutT (NUDIX family)
MEIPKITIARRVLACGTQHFQLSHLTCQRPDGREYVWDVVERTRGVRDVVVVCPVTLDRHVVCIEQFRPPVETRALELPAGICDIPGEALDVTAVRELREETGYTGQILYALPPSAESSGSLTGRMHMFLASAMDRGQPAWDGAEAFMEPRIIEFPLDRLHEALLEYARANPRNLVDPKIMAGAAWWRALEGGGA